MSRQAARSSLSCWFIRGRCIYLGANYKNKLQPWTPLLWVQTTPSSVVLNIDLLGTSVVILIPFFTFFAQPNQSTKHWRFVCSDASFIGIFRFWFGLPYQLGVYRDLLYLYIFMYVHIVRFCCTKKVNENEIYYALQRIFLIEKLLVTVNNEQQLQTSTQLQHTRTYMCTYQYSTYRHTHKWFQTSRYGKYDCRLVYALTAGQWNGKVVKAVFG